MRAILRLLGPLWRDIGLRPAGPLVLVCLGLLAALFEGLSITLVVPLISGQSLPQGGLLGWVTGLFAELPSDRRVVVIVAVILTGIVLKNFLSYAYAALFSWMSTGIGHRLRCAILAQVLGVGQSYLDAQPAGRLVNTLGTETWRVVSVLSTLAEALINLCMVAIFGMLLLALSWKLTLVSGLFFLLVTAVTRLLTRRVRDLSGKAVVANSFFAGRMLEIFSGLRVIRLFGGERREQESFGAASQNVRKTFFHMELLSQAVYPVSEILTAIFLVIVLAAATAGRAEFAGMVAFLLLLYRLQGRVKALDYQRATLEGLAASVEDVVAVLRRDDKPYPAGGNSTAPSLAPGIVFENVSMVYTDRSEPALRGADFLIPYGKTTALVGASGSGKSTVADLICRLYDPTSGRVVVGGVGLPLLDLDWWRRRLAVVSQDVHLFDASIRDNIAYGKPDATEDDIMEAARQAQALDFILALPEGFSTSVGERGIRLSGGQKQRIALARALIRNPEIFLFDEATSALDLESERLVQDALLALPGSKTVLVIAHRLTTVEAADQIIVLEGGRVVEIGSPRQLAAASGAYARLRALQFSTLQEVSRPALSH